MKVAIAGYGAEGEVNYHYWKSQGAEVTVFDENQPSREVPAGAELVVGKDVFANLNGFDLVVRTASLNPKKIKTDGKIWSATNEFFEKCTPPIIGVTGTKGKGTTSSLIYEILKTAGKKVHLAGNIGLPMLEILPEITDDNAVVLELSSFQLWDLTKSPHVAVVLMIEPDHLNIHESFDDYVQAKANIAHYQTATDAIIYHPTNEFSAQIAATSPARKYHYMTSEATHIKNDEIIMNEQRICLVSEVGLLGQHNLENICAAITAAWEFTQDVSAIKQAITTFTGLPHRLEFVAEKNNIKFYDDSQATGAGSCLAALRSFNRPTTLIFGGSDKGVAMTDVINELDQDRHFVVLIGQSADNLETEFKKHGLNNYINLGSEKMEKIVDTALSHTKPGGVILLSPAHASFDMFKSYIDRGDQFKNAVNSL